MSKHTPGEWVAIFGEVYEVREANGGRLAILTNLKGQHGLGGRRTPEEVAANARLIAAAPTMLGALVMARALLVDVEGYEVDGASVSVIDAAIAKATGEAA